MKESRSPQRRVAFVLGGGGHLGANEVGMLQALLERDITPDLIVGTSVGALNGVAIAADPSLDTVKELRKAWLALGKERIFASPLGGAANLVRRGTHLHSNKPLEALIERLLPVKRFEDLKVPFQCVAASIERAAEHWFSEGLITPAILASAAIPGLLPPVEIDGEHYLDGGLVNSIPIERAVALGANEIYIMHVGRVEQPLTVPKNLIQVAMVAFEISRRHRFARDMASLPEGVVGYVMPTGEEASLTGLKQLKYRDFTHVGQRMEASHRASAEFLDNLVAAGKPPQAE